MALTLTPTQAAIWDRGGWDAYHIEQDLLELVDRRQIEAPVVVLLPDGTVAFALTPPAAPRRRGGRP